MVINIKIKRGEITTVDGYVCEKEHKYIYDEQKRSGTIKQAKGTGKD